MKLIFFAHPEFLGHKSMNRFAKLLSEGMLRRGHYVETWTPSPLLSRITNHPYIQKWLGYYDLYFAFPMKVKRMIRRIDSNTLFVITDQSMGPWVPMLKGRPSVIHCHDFLALRSALGEFEENRTSWTGRIYQSYIRKGFSTGKSFISVSKKTKDDLEKYVLETPQLSEVVYNGLHQQFKTHSQAEARAIFSQVTGLTLNSGYLLHVGGNMWYKNRIGVVEIYDAWREITKTVLPLLLIGAPLSTDLSQRVLSSKYRKDIHVLTDVTDEHIGLAYAGCTVFVFPSLGEGFGWPIAEAMASGALVVTTGEVPMSEVGGEAGFYIPRKPKLPNEIHNWANAAAALVDRLVSLSQVERTLAIQKGISNARRFDTDHSLNQIEAIYKRVLDNFKKESR